MTNLLQDKFESKQILLYTTKKGIYHIKQCIEWESLNEDVD